MEDHRVVLNSQACNIFSCKAVFQSKAKTKMQLEGLSVGSMNNSRTENLTRLGQHLLKADFERESVNTAQMNGCGTIAL